MNNKKILDFTLLSIALLVDEYESGKINYQDFKSHIMLKLQYVNENLDNIKPDEKRDFVLETIQRCFTILKQLPADSPYNT